VVTNAKQEKRIREALPWMKPESFLVEPFGRNTAACISLAAIYIKQKDPKAVMVVLPADHIIDDLPEFQKCIRQAVEIARQEGCLMTFGIPPDRVETGYGYIQRSHRLDGDPPVYNIKTFAEKPNPPTAKRFIESGDFYWNSGIFVWRVDVILELLEKFLPDHYFQFTELEKYLDRPDVNKYIRKAYRSIRSISIDYGIMERAESVQVMEGRFGWGDIGSWEEAYRRADKDKNGNAAVGEHLFLLSETCYVNSPRKFVAVVGLKDIIIVESDNALLVCNRSYAQEVKQVVERLERQNLRKLL
jgi:mannose-1-phosphate guanylyltransferase